MPVPMDHAHIPFFDFKQNKTIKPTSCMIDFQNMKDKMANGFWVVYKKAHPEIEAKELNKKQKKKTPNIVKNLVKKK